MIWNAKNCYEIPRSSTETILPSFQVLLVTYSTLKYVFFSQSRITWNTYWIIENERHEISKREKSEKTSVNAKKSSCEEEKKRKKFVPFQYYATTGEADDEPSQLESESTNSTWDQKMEEVQYDSNNSDMII